ncbi:MAG: ABC transporter ATP-binding protein [Spirochaetales bacterium]|nr:ABC transporter ATP-binding protein [Spirochaetales bacterium]
MMSKKILDVKHLKKYYPVSKKSFLHAVDDVSFSIFQGEIFGIVGESGSGKSTIGRSILNLIAIDKGEIYWDGTRIDSLDAKGMLEFRKKMQMVFQNPLASFNPKQYIGSAFSELCKFYKISRHEMNEKIIKLLELINLPADVLTRMPSQLSGGQLQRLSIARSLLLEPDFIVADEPVSALDVSVQAQILNLILDLRDKMGLTILFISHDLNVVERICDRVAVMYLGVIVEMAKKEQLFSHTMHPYTHALIEVNPIEHPSLRKDREIIAGDIPSAVDVGEGCRFAGRCQYCKKGLCDCVTPELIEVESGHWVACHCPF